MFLFILSFTAAFLIDTSKVKTDETEGYLVIVIALFTESSLIFSP
jgi:hypothetical protein